MLKVSNLTKTFTQAGADVIAVNDISFTVDDGEFVSIIGKSGSGKSTLLAQLGALDGPTSGSIEIDDRDITKLHDRALIEYRANKIGFVFQNYNLVPNLTAIENVMLPMEFTRRPKSQRLSRAKELLDQVGIVGDKQQRKPDKLSGGEQQRVSIARAMANSPSIILADEPTGNLDSENGELVFSILHKLAKNEKTTVVVVTHDLDIAGKTNRQLRLQDGKLM